MSEGRFMYTKGQVSLAFSRGKCSFVFGQFLSQNENSEHVLKMYLTLPKNVRFLNIHWTKYQGASPKSLSYLKKLDL